METERERRQRLYRVRGIVLRRRDSGEADRLLTVLARERGKLSLLAKGVRRPASRKAGHIEPFTYVDLLIARGRSLDLVTQAETIEAHRALREDLWRSGWAYYACELADAFTQEADPNEILFDLLLETLGRLDHARPGPQDGVSDGGDEPALAMRYYEMHLLGLVGYQPQLFRCVECGALLQPEVNYLSLERGGMLCPAHGAAQEGTLALPLPAFKVLRFLQTRPWEQVVKLKLNPQLARQVEVILNRYIIYHLERNLSSPAFIQRLRQMRGSAQGEIGDWRLEIGKLADAEDRQQDARGVGGAENPEAEATVEGMDDDAGA